MQMNVGIEQIEPRVVMAKLSPFQHLVLLLKSQKQIYVITESINDIVMADNL